MKRPAAIPEHPAAPRLAAALAFVAVLLTGCGQKGALYLPDGAQERVPPQPTSEPSTTGPLEQSDRDAARPRRVP